MDLVLSYLVIVLSACWHKGKLIEAGEPLEVTRAERSAMLPAVARDATAEEIERYRGGAAQGDDDAGAGLSKAQAEFTALAEQHSTLLEEVDALELKKQVVAGELEALEVSKTTLAEQVTELEKKKAAAKAAK